MKSSDVKVTEAFIEPDGEAVTLTFVDKNNSNNHTTVTLSSGYWLQAYWRVFEIENLRDDLERLLKLIRELPQDVKI